MSRAHRAPTHEAHAWPGERACDGIHAAKGYVFGVSLGRSPLCSLSLSRSNVAPEPHSQGSTPPPPMQPPRGSYITREDRSSGDGHTVAGSWIAGRRKSPLPAVCASPAPIPPVPAAAGAQPLISPKSGSARFPDEEKPLPLVDGLDLHDKQESSSLPDTKSVMPVD